MNVIIRKIDRTLHTITGSFHCDTMKEFAFDSPSEALTHRDRWRYRPRHGMVSVRGDLDIDVVHWLGSQIRGVEDFFHQLEHGAPELRDRMMSMMDEIELPDGMTRPEMTRRRKRTRGDFGNELDIHAAMQGRFDRAWDKLVMEDRSTVGNKLVHMLIDCGLPSMMHADHALWRGAATMRIYEALVRMGKSVAVTVYKGTKDMYPRSAIRHSMVSFPIKRYGEPLREEQLAIASSAAFARCVAMPSTSLTTEFIAGNMGYTVSDYQLRTHSAEEDETHGGAVVVIGKAFEREHAQKIIDDFVRQFVRDETIDGMTRRELYGR